MMSLICFEPEGSSSGRRLYIQVWYGVLYMQYKKSVFYQYQTHSSTYKTAYTDTSRTHYTVLLYTTVFLKKNPRV
jgi:hypothetical protein